MGFDNWGRHIEIRGTLTVEVARFEGKPNEAGRAGLAVSPYHMAAGEVAVTITADDVSDTPDALLPGGFVLFAYDAASRTDSPRVGVAPASTRLRGSRSARDRRQGEPRRRSWPASGLTPGTGLSSTRSRTGRSCDSIG